MASSAGHRTKRVNYCELSDSAEESSQDPSSDSLGIESPSPESDSSIDAGRRSHVDEPITREASFGANEVPAQQQTHAPNTPISAPVTGSPAKVPRTPETAKGKHDPRDKSDELKRDVLDDSPFRDRDAFTLSPNADGVHQYCHVMSFTVQNHQRKRYQVLVRREIHVDSHWNVIIFQPNEHCIFDARLYGFSPTLYDLNELRALFEGEIEETKTYLDVIANRKGDDAHTFHYIPLSRRTSVDVHEVQAVSVSDAYPDGFETVNETRLHQPLAGFRMKSHVHPIYMLWNLAEKINYWDNAGGIPAEATFTEEQRQLVNEVRDMSQGWFNPPTKEEKAKAAPKAFTEPEDDPLKRMRTRSHTTRSMVDGTTVVSEQPDVLGSSSESGPSGHGKRAREADGDSDDGIFGDIVDEILPKRRRTDA